MFLLFICKYTFSRIADYYYIGLMNTGMNLPDLAGNNQHPEDNDLSC